MSIVDIHKKYKNKKHKTQQGSVLTSMLVLSAFVTIYFNFFVFYQISLVHSIVTFIQMFSMIFLIFTVISFNRMVFLFFYIVTILVFSYTFFLGNVYDLYPSSMVLKIILMLDINQFLGSLDIFVVIYILFSIFVALLVLKCLNIYNMPFWQYLRNLAISLFLILISSIVYNISLSIWYKSKYQVGKMLSVEQNIIPMNIYNFLVHHSIFYLLPHDYSVKSVDCVANHTRYKNQPYEDLNIVIVLGETSRKINWALNGYERLTNPKLSNIKNLVYFKNFFSIDTHTLPSSTCMLSMERCDIVREEIKKYIRSLESTSFIDLFHYLGYETYLFSNVPVITNDPRKGLLSPLQNKYIISENNFDHKLLSLLTEVLLQENSQKSNKFFVIQTIGSHFPYNKRYTKEFEIFVPTCRYGSWPHYFGCDNKHLLNEYDNTILSTDDFLSNIIELFQDKKTVLIYVSDHGESLGEDRMYGHGIIYDIAPKEQIEVPAFIWFSTKFLEEFGTEVMEIATQKIDKHMDQEYISHSILDCAFIASDVIDTEKSFCSIN